MGLDTQDHGTLALWAADCAEHVLPHFEDTHPGDNRPRQAIQAGRAWAAGDLAMVEARRLAFAAHAAAREAEDAAAVAAARAAGHAAATAHVPTHAQAAATYARKAVAAADRADAPSGREREWQQRHLPDRLWPLAFSSGPAQ